MSSAVVVVATSIAAAVVVVAGVGRAAADGLVVRGADTGRTTWSHGMAGRARSVRRVWHLKRERRNREILVLYLFVFIFAFYSNKVDTRNYFYTHKNAINS